MNAAILHTNSLENHGASAVFVTYSVQNGHMFLPRHIFCHEFGAFVVVSI